MENKYTRISNGILEALALQKMSGSEAQVMFYLFRKTYGWQKKTDEISLSQFARGTGMLSQHVCRALTKLVDKNILLCDRSGRITRYGINKHYQNWEGVTKIGTTKIGTEVLPELVEKVLPELVHTKETKETIQKKGVFGEFDNVFLFEKDMAKLSERYGIEPTLGIIEELSAYCKSNNKKYSDHYATLLNWAKRKKLPESSEHDDAKSKLVDWLIKHQGRDSRRIDKPKQSTALDKLIHMGVLPNEVKRVLMEIESDEYWQTREEKPDFLTVVNKIQKRG